MNYLVDIEEIKEQFKKVISYSQKIKNPQVDELFETWYNKKLPFIKAFGNKCIYEKEEPVTFYLSDKVKSEKLNYLLEDIYNSNRNLAYFIDANRSTFYDNKISQNFTLENGKDIDQNMKLIKAFKYFEQDEKLLRIFQDRASQIIQENMVTGKLCISVHPLDFLSSSMNTYHWRSCHALDGDYRAGNLSYMSDSCTVMCYLKGENDTQIPLFPPDVCWNSKKWRMLIYISEDFERIFCGKPYPFMSKKGMDMSVTLLTQLLGVENSFKSFSNNKITLENNIIKNIQVQDQNYELIEPYILYQGHLVPKEAFIQDEQTFTPLHFNDVLYSSTYKPYYAFSYKYLRSLEDIMNKKIIVGNTVKCLDCGKEFLKSPHNMRCYNCETKYEEQEEDLGVYCDCCGSLIQEDSCYTAISGNEYFYLCKDCLTEQCIECESCHNFFFSNEIPYNRVKNSYICNNCNNNNNIN